MLQFSDNTKTVWDQNTNYPTCLRGELQQHILGKANRMVGNYSHYVKSMSLF